MIVLDTNVISELMRPQPHPAVFAWVAEHPSGTLCTTSVNKAEILYGIAALPEGRRRTGLIAAAEAMFSKDFAGRYSALCKSVQRNHGRRTAEDMRARTRPHTQSSRRN